MAEPLDELRDSLTGDVLVEGDCEYERARLCFNLLIDRRPAAIARCVGAKDVAAALAFGQARGLEIAVRGGGHNPAGHCVVDERPGDRPLAYAGGQRRSREGDRDVSVPLDAGR
jgi:hypothetical protein